MTIEEAQAILGTRTDSVLNPDGTSKVLYYPESNNQFGVWLNEAQFIEHAKRQKERTCQSGKAS